MNQSDEQLMIKNMEGDKEALEFLYQRYKKRIFNFCYRILSNRADAEEATGDFFAALSSGVKYKESAKFVTWAYTVARNICVSCMRKRLKWQFLWIKSYESGTYEEIQLPDHKADHANDLAQADMAEHIKQVINKLPEREKTLIVLREYEQLSYNEIADITELTVSQVKVGIFRTREKLRKMLAPLVKEANHA